MHHIIVGLGFGDEGKGTTTEFYVRKKSAPAVIRFSGGPQTAHNVVLEDGRHHTFHQYGSGTLNGAVTITSRFALFNPVAFAYETEELRALVPIENTEEMMYVSCNTPLISFYHRALNMWRETQRGDNPHGSCGDGIGETMKFIVEQGTENAPLIGDINNRQELTRKLGILEQYVISETNGTIDLGEFPNVEGVVSAIMDAYRVMPFAIVDDTFISEYIASHDDLVFEGTQGVLLDEWHGFHPHTTWSTTTSKNAHILLDEAGIPKEQRTTVGVTRSYLTRHGYGPMPTEYPLNVPEAHNTTGKWMGGWRQGFLDPSLLNYAVRVDGNIDSLSITHMDSVASGLISRIAEDYEDFEVHGENMLEEREKVTNRLMDPNRSLRLKDRIYESIELITHIERAAGIKATLLSYGPCYEDKIEL